MNNDGSLKIGTCRLAGARAERTTRRDMRSILKGIKFILQAFLVFFCNIHRKPIESVVYCFYKIERFSYDLEMKTREQNKNNKRTEIERFDWFIEPDTNSRGFCLVKRTLGWKNVMPENFLEIKRYFALTSYCNTIVQSNNSFCLLGFSLARKRRVHVLIFSSTG